eukprot:m.39582 g.39582  ORF g.39582 m.39582 type:complete len:74 (+) comp5953_c0_seq4:519-740(+)
MRAPTVMLPELTSLSSILRQVAIKVVPNRPGFFKSLGSEDEAVIVPQLADYAQSLDACVQDIHSLYEARGMTP